MSPLSRRMLARLSQGPVECVCYLRGWQVVRFIPNSMNQIGQCTTDISLSLSIPLPGCLTSSCQPLHLFSREISLVLEPTFACSVARGAKELKSPTSGLVKSSSSEGPE